MRFTQYINEAREMLKQWKKYLSTNKELSAGVDILNKINKAGYNAYFVGGVVRDIVIGRDFNDIDIASNIDFDNLSKIFKIYDIGKSKDFGISVIKYKGFNFEIARYRSDGKYEDGRRPETVKFNVTLKDDMSRRDIQINAMAIDKNGNIIDYFDGKKDIKNKLLRTVGDPYKRFGEDHLRIMRAARFSSKLGFEIEKDTKKAAQKLSNKILELSPERIKDEIMKAAAQSGDKFADYIIELDKLKILKHILPEVLNLKFWRENLQHHPETRGGGGTVWTHTMEALRKSNTADPIANLSILLHDVGKGVTFSQKEGLPKYLGHAKASIDLVDSIADRLKMSNKERQSLIFAVGNHMKFHNILKMKPSKISKLVNDENWDVLVAVSRADEFSRGETFMYAGEFEKIINKAIEIKNKWGKKQLKKTNNIINGNRIMELLNLSPGPIIGKIKSDVMEEILNNNIKDKEEIDKLIIKIGNKYK